MARSDLLITLVKAALSGDSNAVTRTVEALTAEERAKRNSGIRILDTAIALQQTTVALKNLADKNISGNC